MVMETPIANEQSTDVLPLEKETRQLFFQLGTAALNNLLGTHGIALFSALEKVEPDQAYAKVGLGMTHLCCSNFDEAARYFNDPIVQSSPLAASASALLAISSKMEGNASAFESASAKALEGDPSMDSTIESLRQVTL
jgi:hypothetical protein